ncbi:low affinity iron permease family protein [Mesorhizobium sp. VK25A]|uniref:Low affinity iron permease family protein n=1 Tax=Mesorhizobium vachelliae TaxID=3072309 RepID=A0ABU5AD36_9HYPH|nr:MULTISPECIES: low affinity iron permease family protein [unclassified Mesorhizobium]MDX8534969.1 low affinity iron permease family protein [Mesorhizobium sp. VK25D]MDX8547479.1 low affinity iron permease family protein [Mesorhizobium sp. VK25A]
MIERVFTKIANRVAHLAGLPSTFAICVAIVVAWALSGPFFGFSDTWQLVINTGTTIITFLMVFLIQNTQNRDGAAIQAKLDELIRVSRAHNHFIGIEHLTESEVEEIRDKCERAAKRHDRKIAEAAANKAVAEKNGTKHAPKTADAGAKKTTAGKNGSKKKAA